MHIVHPIDGMVTDLAQTLQSPSLLRLALACLCHQERLRTLLGAQILSHERSKARTIIRIIEDNYFTVLKRLSSVGLL